MIDIHCHILPGVDDGATTVAQAIDMAQRAASDGIRTIVATPHAFDGTYETTRPQTEAALERLRTALERRGIRLDLLLGSDCRLDDRLFADVRPLETLTLGGGPYLLVELPANLVPAGVEEAFFRLQSRGVRPILTHPERHPELSTPRGPARIADWIERGLRVQVTAQSITGGFGRRAARSARTLLREGLCHFVATDAHDPVRRPPLLSAARRTVKKLAGESVAARLFEQNPGRAIRGEAVAR